MTLIPNTKKPILYFVHTDSIMGPTVGIPDAFGDTPLNVGGASNPDEDYICFSLPQCEWVQTWEQRIMLRHRKVHRPDGYESDDAAYEVQADGEVVYIGEDFEAVKEGKIEEGELEEDGVDQPATSNRKRKTQTEKAPARKKAPSRKKPGNRPKPLTPIKKAPSKKPPSGRT